LPIRKEWRKYYRGREWEAARMGLLKRAGGKFDEAGKYIGGAKCQQCGKPDRERVETFSDLLFGPRMFWRAAGSGWRDQTGEALHPSAISLQLAPFGYTTRVILVKIGMAHLDHNPANNFEYNLGALCQWCHLYYDAPHHKETRATRKDAARPLLVEALAWGREFEALAKDEVA
jgi:hypothetical protein